MNWDLIHTILVFFQRTVSTIGILIILVGALTAFYHYLNLFVFHPKSEKGHKINTIRLHLGRTLILGLEFIVAADLIGSTTTPDYYSVGLLAVIVMIRTLLSFSINRELMSLSKEK